VNDGEVPTSRRSLPAAVDQTQPFPGEEPYDCSRKEPASALRETAGRQLPIPGHSLGWGQSRRSTEFALAARRFNIYSWGLVTS